MREQAARITATLEPWQRSIELRFGVLIDGKWQIAQPLQLVQAPSEVMYVVPFTVLQPEVAQSLIDELWRCGLRPTEGSGSAGSLAATERHLADMRRIALEALETHGLLRAPVELITGPADRSE